MKHIFEDKLLEQLENDLKKIAYTNSVPLKRLSAPFIRIRNHLIKLKNYVIKVSSFNHRQEEIAFFKQIKMLFYSKYIFESKSYNIQRNARKASILDLINYYTNELRRLHDLIQMR